MLAKLETAGMPNPQPLFSIIVPTYNREKLIGKTLDSILSQSFADFEVLVIDDGSKDGTEGVVGAINDARLSYFKKENAERGAARNYGIKKARGQYITFVDSDDLLYANHFDEAAKYLQTHTNAPVFHLAYEYRDTEGKLLATQTHWKNLNRQLVYGNVISCIGIFIKREILKDDLVFSEERALSGTEDWLLWLRLAARFSFGYSNEVTACMINHESRSVLNYDEESMRLRTELLLQNLRADQIFMNAMGRYLPIIEAHMYSYMAIHLAMSGKKGDALRYFWKALIQNPGEFFTRRTLAIGKWVLLPK